MEPKNDAREIYRKKRIDSPPGGMPERKRIERGKTDKEENTFL